jgi:thiol-disulfide isomerase/thioredoxin
MKKGRIMTAKRKIKSTSKLTGSLPTLLILAGVVLLVTVVFLLKTPPAKNQIPADALPEAQLDWYLEHNQPVFVFYHSTTCKTCTDMMAVVDQVYPEFKDRVGLVDVDVYQVGNENLLRRARITNIPTQVFINEKGQGMTQIGGMQPENLRTALQALAGGLADGN